MNMLWNDSIAKVFLKPFLKLNIYNKHIRYALKT